MNKKTYKDWVPNLLTASRIVFTPIIIALGYFNKMSIVIVIVILAAITDLFDGKLARKWNTVSLFGAKLDAVADKVFAIGLIASLCRKFPILLVPFSLEILIGLLNLIYYYKLKQTKSLMIGKIKTCFLFTSVVLGFIVSYYSKVNFLLNGFVYATINLQILSLIAYYLYYKENSKNKVPSPLVVLNEVDEETEPTIMLEDLQDLINEMNDEV